MNLNNEILNYGLELSMEFGENWLTDVDKRLKDKFPEITTIDSKYYNQLFNEVNKCAHNFVRDNPIREGNEINFIDFSKFKDFMRSKYSWINNTNLSKLYSQSCYYALK